MKSIAELVDKDCYMIKFQQLKYGMPLNTVADGLLFVSIADNGTTMNKANILGRDFEGVNGTIHTIDKVMMLP